jgi:hypothetical protein
LQEVDKMLKKDRVVFSLEIPPDLDHAPQIREEALDWLEMHYPGSRSFTTGDVLRMAGEPNRRWLIARLRAHDIGNEAEFSLPETADALTALFLRSKGVKFRDSVDAVIGKRELLKGLEPRYGGVWNRLIIAALEGMRRRVPARLLASVVFALLRDPKDHINCMVIVKRCGKQSRTQGVDKPSHVTHDYVYQIVLERPAPSCAVVAPSREVMFFAPDQLPARSEVTSRHFTVLRVTTEIEKYELLLGTMKPVNVLTDSQTLQFVGRVLDVVYHHFEAFVKVQSSSRLETPVEPEQTSASDLQLWLTTQFLSNIYAGSLCEINETSPSTHATKVLVSSVARPWEPSPWEPAKSLEMLSGYSGITGVPLVVENVGHPWTQVIEGIETELHYLKSKGTDQRAPMVFSSLALPITSSFGESIGSLYLLMPRLAKAQLGTEVRILSIFSRIIGETIERFRAATFSAEVSANIVSLTILNREQFRVALLELLSKQARELYEDVYLQRDVRLPFILVSAHSAETDQFDPAVLDQLKYWLVETLHHLEWRSFVKSHLPSMRGNWDTGGFIGEVPGIGIMIAPGNLVTKDELDQIRNAFPATFNRTSPTNSPVKLVSWVLDVPAQRIKDATKGQKLPSLADEIENWAFDVATMVEDLAQSSTLRDEGEWDTALRRIRRALQKPGAHNNSYLRRLAVDCSLAMADWPGALKYAQEAVSLSGQELGSGLVRSLCMEADAHLCLCNPIRAWDLYSEAALTAPSHPLPRYYRGKALLLIARLLSVYEEEQRRITRLDTDQEQRIVVVLGTLIDGAMEDLTSAADLLERWGLIPETYQYRNFHLVPTLMGQGLGYLLKKSPGPAASRLQSARHSFPKDDLFFREFLFAKCWEQGIHRQYAGLLLSDTWKPLCDRLQETFGQPHY